MLEAEQEAPQPASPSRRRLWVVLAAVGLGAVVVLIAAKGSTLDYYGDVDSLVASEAGALASDRAVRVMGTVVPGSLQRDLITGESRFLLRGRSSEVEVIFYGALPPLFEPGEEAVVTGRLQPEGRFQASEVLSKCPSKFEPVAENL